MYRRARLFSAIAMFFSLGLVALAVWNTYKSMSARYFLLLVAGLILGFISTPFYYYYKSRVKNVDVRQTVAIKTLNGLGQQLREEHKKTHKN